MKRKISIFDPRKGRVVEDNQRKHEKRLQSEAYDNQRLMIFMMPIWLPNCGESLIRSLLRHFPSDLLFVDTYIHSPEYMNSIVSQEIIEGHMDISEYSHATIDSYLLGFREWKFLFEEFLFGAFKQEFKEEIVSIAKTTGLLSAGPYPLDSQTDYIVYCSTDMSALIIQSARTNLFDDLITHVETFSESEEA